MTMFDPHRYVGLPQNSFALTGSEQLRRPDTVRRLAFEQVYPRAYWFEAAPFARAVVPIELAKMGDKQVVVHSRAGERLAPLSIDFLADIPSVNSVAADRLVFARRPLPQVQELFVLNPRLTVDQETLSNLPGLISLSLGSGWLSPGLDLEGSSPFEGEADKIDLKVLHRMPGLRDLRFHALAVNTVEPIHSLTGLERLRIEGVPSGRDARLLAPLTELRWLALEYWKGLRNLSGLTKLERVELMEASLANMKGFSAWGSMRSLAISGRGLKSLEGIGALKSLQELFLGYPGIRDLAPLAAGLNLRRLRLVNPDKVEDFNPIGQLTDLRLLMIQLGSITSTGHLESIDFVAGLNHLQELEITNTVIDDGRLDAVFRLPKIKRVRLLGRYGNQVEELRRQKPDCVIEVIADTPEDSLSDIQVGALKIRQVGMNLWSIFQDLSDLLDVDNNFIADEKIRHAIQRQEPGLFKRLEFDPDADFVSIIARNEADIHRAADIIQSMFERPDASGH